MIITVEDQQLDITVKPVNYKPVSYHPPSLIIKFYGDLAKRHSRISQSLILAVIEQESAGDPAAISHADCFGLMQLSQYALIDYNRKFETNHTLIDILGRDGAALNITIGSWYLDWCINQAGSTENGLRAYNVGIGTIKKDHTAGAEYARSVLVRKRKYQLLT